MSNGELLSKDLNQGLDLAVSAPEHRRCNAKAGPLFGKRWNGLGAWKAANDGQAGEVGVGRKDWVAFGAASKKI